MKQFVLLSGPCQTFLVHLGVLHAWLKLAMVSKKNKAFRRSIFDVALWVHPLGQFSGLLLDIVLGYVTMCKALLLRLCDDACSYVGTSSCCGASWNSSHVWSNHALGVVKAVKSLMWRQGRIPQPIQWISFESCSRLCSSNSDLSFGLVSSLVTLKWGLCSCDRHRLSFRRVAHVPRSS